MQCPPTEVLSFYASAEPDHRDQNISTHLENCQACQAALTLLESGGMAPAGPATTVILPESSSFEPNSEATTALGSAEHTESTSDGEDTADYRDNRGSRSSQADCLESLIGRYRIIRRLGQGSFGTVFLATDTELERLVAIKLAHRERIRKSEDIEFYLEEAKALASLDHPHVLPVFDVGRTEDGSFYLVSKYVEGTDLSGLIVESPPSQIESARLIARIADGLDHAHRQGLIHRDIKPANILIGSDAHPYLADFGLAVRESDSASQGGLAGTPEYMSPEQARGENHRIDTRSDIYSLGVVFFRMLTGQRPYEGTTLGELLDKVVHLEVPSLRELNPGVAPELERICRKMLEKRAADRYQSAADLVTDLEEWELSGKVGQGATSSPPTPKGLRAYDAADAGSFLALLPGPRDREGLPDSVAFWKRKIDSSDLDAFPVGLLIGSSGSGKSSLISAGVLPRLARHVVPIFVDLSRGRVEPRILVAVRSAFPNLAPDLQLRDMLSVIRRGGSATGRRKALIVLDQFEQHLATSADDVDLIEALRQCDGVSLQALLVVRDDFALSASRFFERLEVPLVQGQNFAVIDRFSVEHARNVLIAFGRAFGKIPQAPATPNIDQQRFLDRALDELASMGDVSPVKLAVFAEMVRDQPWTPTSLKVHGGLEGLGVAFLESLIGSASANPRLRALAGPARTLLRELLPPPGGAIRGGARSVGELKTVVGSNLDDLQFKELIVLLESEARLIRMVGDEPDGHPADSVVGYQLTHDYLVPSLRAWLTLKQRETARGRAELLLAERAAGWSLDPSTRQLPLIWEMPSILTLTRPRLWTAPERLMMRQASRHHGRRVGVACISVLFVSILGFLTWRGLDERRLNEEVSGLVARLIDSDPAQVPGVVGEIKPRRIRTNALLDVKFRQEPEGSRPRRRAALGLLDSRPELAVFLAEELRRPGLDLAEVLLIADALETHAEPVKESLWASVGNLNEEPDRRFAAALALARIDPLAESWRAHAKFVADRLLARLVANPAEFGPLVEALRPSRAILVGPLLDRFRTSTAEVRPIAFNLLTRFAAGDPEALVALLVDAEPSRIGELLPLLQRLGPAPIALLDRQLSEKLIPRFDDPPRTLPDPPDSASAALGKGGGWVDPAFALCQSLPLVEFEVVADSLREAGYRPIRVRPYADGSGTSIAAVWNRDGRKWRLAVGLTAEEMTLRQASMAREGFEVVDVAAFLVPSGELQVEKIAAVWVQAEPGEFERRVTFGLDDKAFEKTLANYEDDGFVALTHQVLDLDRGVHRSHSLVWARSGLDAALRFHRFDGSVGDYGGDIFLGEVETDVSLGVTDRPMPLVRRLEDKLRNVEAKLKEKPLNPDLLFQRGNAHFELGQYDEALKDWDDLILKNPAYAWMWKFPRMTLYARRGDLEQAHSDLNDYLAHAKGRKYEGNIAYMKAYLAACEGDVAGAVDRLLHDIEAHPGDPSFLSSASMVMSRIAGLAEKKAIPEANQYAEQAIDLLEASVKAGLKLTPEVRDDPDFEPIHERPRFSSLVGLGRLEDRYTAIWQGIPGLESTELHGLSPAEHSMEARKLAANGWRPAAIGEFKGSADSPTITASVWHRPSATRDELLHRASRQANAALALIRLGRDDLVWPLLKHRADPTLATDILHRFAVAGIEPAVLADRLVLEPDPEVRRVLILGLGLMPPSRLTEDLRSSLAPLLSKVFVEDPNPGVHSAAEWTLRQVLQVDPARLTEELASARPREGFGWFVDRSGNTLLIASHLTFEMGARPEEVEQSATISEALHRREVPRRFAIASKEVTNAQFARFLDETPAFKPLYTPRKDYSPEADGPAISVPWTMALAYCRWLTRKEGMGEDQQCYDEVDSNGSDPIRFRAGYLIKTGYRLPTEAEWECAARAGTTTRWPFGWSDDPVTKYAWFDANSVLPGFPRPRAQPVGRLLPDELGCFDMLGNVAEWTSNRFRLYPSARPARLARDNEPIPRPGKPAVDKERLDELSELDDLVFRGGAYSARLPNLRPAARHYKPRGFTAQDIGFRVVRTLPD